MNSTASAHQASGSRRVPALETGEFEVGGLLAEIATEVFGHFADEIGGNFHLHSGTRATLLVPLSSSSREP